MIIEANSQLIVGKRMNQLIMLFHQCQNGSSDEAQIGARDPLVLSLQGNSSQELSAENVPIAQMGMRITVINTEFWAKQKTVFRQNI